MPSYKITDKKTGTYREISREDYDALVPAARERLNSILKSPDVDVELIAGGPSRPNTLKGPKDKGSLELFGGVESKNTPGILSSIFSRDVDPLSGREKPNFFDRALGGIMGAGSSALTGRVSPGALLIGGAMGAAFPPMDEADAAMLLASGPLSEAGGAFVKGGGSRAAKMARAAAGGYGAYAGEQALASGVENVLNKPNKRPAWTSPLNSPQDFLTAMLTGGLPALTGEFTIPGATKRSPVQASKNIVEEFMPTAPEKTVTRVSDLVPVPGLKAKLAGTNLDKVVGSNTDLANILKTDTTLGTNEVASRVMNKYQTAAQKEARLLAIKTATGDELADLEHLYAQSPPDKQVSLALSIRRREQDLKKIEKDLAFLNQRTEGYDRVLSGLEASDATVAATMANQRKNMEKLRLQNKARLGGIDEQIKKLDFEIRAKRRELKLAGENILESPELEGLIQQKEDFIIDQIRQRSGRAGDINAAYKTELNNNIIAQKRRGELSKELASVAERKSIVNEAVANAKAQKLMLAQDKGTIDNAISQLKTNEAKFGSAISGDLKNILNEVGQQTGVPKGDALRNFLMKPETPASTVKSFFDYFGKSGLGGQDSDKILQQVRDDVVNEIFKQGYNRDNKTLSGLSKVITSLGPEKIDILFGKDRDRFYQLLGDLDNVIPHSSWGGLSKPAAFYAAVHVLPDMLLVSNPSLTTTAKLGVSAGLVFTGLVWPKLVNGILRDSKLADQFHAWANGGATKEMLQSLPYLYNYIKDQGYEFNEERIRKWGAVKQPQTNEAGGAASPAQSPQDAAPAGTPSVQ